MHTILYTTKEQLISQFGEQTLLMVSDRQGLGEIDEQVLNAAILRASSEVDSYLATRFKLPLENVPEIITSITGDIVLYRLVGGDISETDPIITRYERAIKFLQDIAKGLAGLPIVNDINENENMFSSGVRVWNQVNL